MTINNQIQTCFHDLNVLKEMVEAERNNEWDLGWQLNQIENASCCLWKIMEVDA